jgi:hypothetical protein
MPTNGWLAADAEGNTVGIQGAFYTFGDVDDGGDFVIEPASYENAGGTVCAKGTAEIVQNAEYDIYWGGAIGFNLNQNEGEDTANPFNAQAAGVTGFGFHIGPLPVGGQLRFNVVVAGDTNNYCKAITGEQSVMMRWEDLQQSCWAAMPVTPDPTNIEAIHWQIVTNDANSYEFDFCVEGLVALTD